ncbi:hypothetical protein [Microvirga pudoricolor]|uniref:hypothetical protein n=1 Tax=Microvirga pudoricolor TaxID=2778729 RepID=UPI00194F616A|nr:hypothetical protein [Microvirga pudoricolor]MBM6595916.1 hypothetical protein [Microvirga pudoricolor]
MTFPGASPAFHPTPNFNWTATIVLGLVAGPVSAIAGLSMAGRVGHEAVGD